ncbi:M20/M25/M40 family metallo-hydrolase [soil metagenome]
MPDLSRLSERLTALTRELVLIRSTDSRPDERARCFEFIRHHLDTVPGTEIYTYEDGGYTSLVALPGGCAPPAILLCGHIDVVDHPGLESYHSTIDGGHIIGPGSGDMKGAVAIMLVLFRALHRAQPGISVGIALTSDEERGGEHGLRFLVESVGLRCGTAIVPDGGSQNEITVEEKGILHLAVSAVGSAAHAARPWLGTNALQHLVSRLAVLHGHFPHPSAGGDPWVPTCTLTALSSPNTAFNCVPDRAAAVLDVRFPPPHTAAGTRATIAELLGPGLAVETIIAAEPTHLDSDPLFHEITAEVTGLPAIPVKACGGSDARFLRAHHIPVNLSRPTVGKLHAEDEWIDIASMLTHYRIC